MATPTRGTTADDLAGDVAELDQFVTGDTLPPSVSVRLSRIRDTLDDLLQEASAAGDAEPSTTAGSAGSDGTLALVSDLVVAARRRVLTGVRGYQHLPRDYAQSRPVAGGRTTLLVLVDDLDLVGLSLDRVYDALVRRDDEALRSLARGLGEAP